MANIGNHRRTREYHISQRNTGAQNRHCHRPCGRKDRKEHLAHQEAQIGISAQNVVKPLCIDLFCGLGGWTEGFLAEGYDVIGFDTERHEYWVSETESTGSKLPGRSLNRGAGKWKPANGLGFEKSDADQSAQRTRLAQYPGQLVLQDVLTLHGSQFRNAAVIVASPPCQVYSYRAMPWKRATALPPPDNTLFEACFRIQREACEAAGRYIPLVLENVCGAQKWVGRAAWHYGSFYLWGDVPALMPYGRASKAVAARGEITRGNGDWFGTARCDPTMKNTGGSWFGERDDKPLERNDPRDMRRNEDGEYVNAAATGGLNHPGKALDGVKVSGIKLREVGFNVAAAQRYRAEQNGTKQGGNWWHDPESMTRKFSSRSDARKAASAQIAKIPFPLAQHIARVYKPDS